MPDRHYLACELERVAQRLRDRRWWLGTAVLGAVFALVAVLLLVLHWRAELYWWLAVPVLLTAYVVAQAIWWWVAQRSWRDPRAVGREIERRYPHLDCRLLAVLEPSSAEAFGGYLRERVTAEVVAHARRSDWQQVVTDFQRQLLRFAGFAALGLLAVLLVWYSSLAPTTENSVIAHGNPQHVASGPLEILVEPGDAEIERGSPLLVVARFPRGIPDQATIVYRTSSANEETGRSEQQSSMSRSLDDPLFAYRIPRVQQPLSYRVQYADRTTQNFQVRVFDYPALVRADAELKYPEYTGLSSNSIEDTRQVSAVEGTRVTWRLYVNKPLAKVELRSEGAEPIPLSRREDFSSLDTSSETKALYECTVELQESRRYEVHLLDDEGRTPRQAPELVMNVLPNQPPQLKLVNPGRDIRVTPLQELQLVAEAFDDFGVQQFGISYNVGSEQHEQVLASNISGQQQHRAEHTLALEELNVEPNQLVAYHVWADDVGKDGATRRVFSDIYFAEVRPFEEVFREGQQPPGGAGMQGQGAGEQSTQLLELQKQIIIGTWKLVHQRRLDARFVPDVQVLLESQQTALEQAQELASEAPATDPDPTAQDVLRYMNDAVKHLLDAYAEKSADPLTPALAAEQAAYQALLRLRPNEYQVMRGSPSSGAGGAASRQPDAQLQQLELSSSENRYETQRQAGQNSEQRELRQALNRLRELAQRQDDLNEQMRQLESQLQTAQTQREREELERQLKRLRDEQQQILRDLDELQERMQRPENQQRLASERQQLEQTRSDVRQSSEALEQGQVGQAVASGTRAQRSLEQMRDQLRQRTSDEFAEDMQQMRRDAEQLQERQRRLGQELAERSQERTLRGSEQRQALQEDLRKQRQELTQLLEAMTDVVQESEQSEPLLSRQLYDALRDAKQQQLEENLDVTRDLVQQGFLEPASEAEQAVRRGVDELAEDIRRAARSVVGDETEALQRARDELESLSRELQQELEQADPSAVAGNRPGTENREQANSEQQQGGSSAEAHSEQLGQRGTRPGESNASTSESGPGQRAEENADSQLADNNTTGSPGNSSSSDQSDRESESPAGSQQASSARSGSPSDQATSGAPDRSGQQSSASSPTRRSPGLRTPEGDLAGGGVTRGGAEALQELLDSTLQPAMGPITGGGYLPWSDRLRDVEELLEDDTLRADVARIRERARNLRTEYKRHSREPQWDLVRELVAEPLVEVTRRVEEELLRRSQPDALVPIDRDPVPPGYAEAVQRYYERLGAGR